MRTHQFSCVFLAFALFLPQAAAASERSDGAQPQTVLVTSKVRVLPGVQVKWSKTKPGGLELAADGTIDAIAYEIRESRRPDGQTTIMAEFR
ncbi:hypothetical protein P7228_11635 [Altererythrobacter arenosus]|uniref:Uncharacterized protein n=1 Tax=Altererythrobacter arenosus TaxID=3032592 RepID=A0ABY8FNP4_9SPHN|nr:hypothetical protein [Altererythrobacter sp. CAU 1644]WFL76644.1 hypothetical protein P7228_11635 [Altererythrobacter sp. CAU 1644]